MRFPRMSQSDKGRERKKQEDKANEARRLEFCQEMDTKATKLKSRRFLTLGTHFKIVTDYRPYCFCLSVKYHES